MKLRQFSALGSRFDRYEFAAGEGLPAHQHDEDHLTLVVSGRIVARSGGKEIERGPDDTPILFRAGRMHEIVALDNDTVVLNVFSEAR